MLTLKSAVIGLVMNSIKLNFLTFNRKLIQLKPVVYI